MVNHTTLETSYAIHSTDVAPAAPFPVHTEFMDVASVQVQQMATALQQAIRAAQTTPIHHDLQYTLHVAQRKLQAAHVPQLLRLNGYLRLCARSVQTVSPALGGSLYQQLLQTLFTLDSHWWNHCEITPEGAITSTHADVQFLLDLLQGFVHAVQMKQ